MNHCFDCEDAAKYGLLEAILISNFQHWIKLNRDNGRNLHDDRTWTYNSVKALHEQYFYVSADKIRRALDNLETLGIIVKGNYNERPGDRTTWYAFTDESKWLPPADHLARVPNGIGKGAKPIGKGAKSTNTTDINTDINAVAPSGSTAKASFSFEKSLKDNGVNGPTADQFIAQVKAKTGDLTEAVFKTLADEAKKANLTLQDTLAHCIAKGWARFDASWLAPQAGGQAVAPVKPILPVEQQLPSLTVPKGKKPEGLGSLKALVKVHYAAP